MNDLLDYLLFAVPGIICLLLAVVVFALVFGRKFRKDILAAEGKAHVGPFSAKGTAILGLIVILSGGLWFLLDKATESRTQSLGRFIDSLHLDTRDPDLVRLRVIELKAQESSTHDADSLRDDELLDLIRALDPDKLISEAIRGMVSDSLGPWNRFPKSVELLVSIPGRLPPGLVRGCPERHGETLETISGYSRDGNRMSESSSVTLEVGELIFAVSDCRKLLGYDLQLNCHDALQLFSDQVLTCDSDHNPLWKEGVEERLLPIYVTVLR